MIQSQEDERAVGIEVFFTDSKGIGGKLRKSSEDFIVDEVSQPPPLDDSGEYTIVKLRVNTWETNRLVRELARRLHISRRRITFAGTKDRRAVTTQLFSIKAAKEDVEKLNLKDVEIQDAYTSRKGLDLGDLIGNRFSITIRDFQGSVSDVQDLVAEVKNDLEDLGGFPNFFGHQRFGSFRPITHIVGRRIMEGDFKGAVLAYLANPQMIEGEEAYLARKAVSDGEGYADALKMFPKYLGFEKAMLNHLIANEDDYKGAIGTLPRNLQMMFVHAFQSYLLNKILSLRIKKGLLSREPLRGDLVLPIDNYKRPDHKKWIKVSEDNEEKIKKRITQGKAFISGLVPGAQVELAEGEMGEIERKVLEEERIYPENFIVPELRELSSKGMRRELIAPAKDFTIKVTNSGITMNFELFKGCYATVLLREFMKTDMLCY